MSDSGRDGEMEGEMAEGIDRETKVVIGLG